MREIERGGSERERERKRKSERMIVNISYIIFIVSNIII